MFVARPDEVCGMSLRSTQLRAFSVSVLIEAEKAAGAIGLPPVAGP
jgi:hypothetical protein